MCEEVLGLHRFWGGSPERGGRPVKHDSLALRHPEHHISLFDGSLYLTCTVLSLISPTIVPLKSQIALSLQKPGPYHLPPIDSEMPILLHRSCAGKRVLIFKALYNVFAMALCLHEVLKTQKDLTKESMWPEIAACFKTIFGKDWELDIKQVRGELASVLAGFR